MRTREEIEQDQERLGMRRNSLIVELLLDIREILLKDVETDKLI